MNETDNMWTSRCAPKHLHGPSGFKSLIRLLGLRSLNERLDALAGAGIWLTDWKRHYSYSRHEETK